MRFLLICIAALTAGCESDGPPAPDQAAERTQLHFQWTGTTRHTIYKAERDQTPERLNVQNGAAPLGAQHYELECYTASYGAPLEELEQTLLPAVDRAFQSAPFQLQGEEIVPFTLNFSPSQVGKIGFCAARIHAPEETREIVQVTPSAIPVGDGSARWFETGAMFVSIGDGAPTEMFVGPVCPSCEGALENIAWIWPQRTLVPDLRQPN